MSPYIPSFLEMQHPNYLDGVDKMAAAIFAAMATKPDDDPLGSEAGRLIAVRKLYAGDNATKFAKDCGFTVQQWNNFERGFAFSRNAAFQLRRIRPVISVQWIWWGDESAMSVSLLDQLRRAAATGKGSKRGPSTKAR